MRFAISVLFTSALLPALGSLSAGAYAQSFGRSRGSTQLGVTVSPLTANSVELGVEAKLNKNLSLGLGYNPGVWRVWDKNTYDRSGFGWNLHGKYFPWGQSLFVGGRLAGNQIQYEGVIAGAGAGSSRHREYGYYMHAHATVGWQKTWANGFSLGSEVGAGPNLLTRRRSYPASAEGLGNAEAASLVGAEEARNGRAQIREALEKHAAPLNLYVNLLSFGYIF